MKKYLSSFNTRNTAPAVLGSIGAIFLVALVAWASTTIGDNISTAGSLTISGTATSTNAGGLTTVGLDSSNGLRVSTGDTVLTGGLQVLGTSFLSGNVGAGSSSPSHALAVNGTIDVGGSATSTVLVTSTTAARGGCIQLKSGKDANTWIRIYPGGGAGVAGGPNSFVASSTVSAGQSGNGLLVIEQGQCTP